jgi:hypothetical protein
MNFPKFDGENPRLWITWCEDYFDLYTVHPAVWIKCATMNFVNSSPAARWLQSLDPQVKQLPWQEFCHLVLDRFGKAQYEALVRQMFSIRQTSTVQDYIDRFAGLIDSLVAYGRGTDPVFFAMRFVDGLKDDIRNAVHMQRPQTFDTASVFALLQEELHDPTKKKELRRPDLYSFGKPALRGALPLPLPPRGDKIDRAPAAPSSGDDRRPRGLDDKLRTLRDYRRARGLCIKCGENGLMITVAPRQYNYMFCRSSEISVIRKIPGKALLMNLAALTHKCYWLSQSLRCRASLLLMQFNFRGLFREFLLISCWIRAVHTLLLVPVLLLGYKDRPHSVPLFR